MRVTHLIPTSTLGGHINQLSLMLSESSTCQLDHSLLFWSRDKDLPDIIRPNLDAPITHAVMCGWGGAPTDQLDLYASKEWHAQAIRLAEGLETDNPEAITDDMARAWRGAADNNGTNRFALAARLRSGDSGEPGLNPLNIDVPVLVICGEEDKDPHEFAAALPNATGKVVRGGHATAARDPELFVAAADFLAKEVSQ